MLHNMMQQSKPGCMLLYAVYEDDIWWSEYLVISALRSQKLQHDSKYLAHAQRNVQNIS